MTKLGLDVCVESSFDQFAGQAIAVVCNQASIDSGFDHVLDLLLPHHRSGRLKIVCAFGPQHGIWGHTQDNMIEWEGYSDPRTGLRFHSLYGETRVPTASMLEGVERLVFDVPDIGARYYTFIWTLANCMKACSELGVPVTVLDRPNPITGAQVEGPVLSQGFESFVGLYPLPVRHGMSVGEIAGYFHSTFYPNCDLTVVQMEGWDRRLYTDEAETPWAMPSPNMPTVETAVVYPGQCLLEGTNLSEGRGTTRPFEIFGSPWIDAYSLTERLEELELPGVKFRPYHFEPTFQKHVQTYCHGAFLHVTDRSVFRPFLTTVSVLAAVRELFPTQFGWNPPPYEYELIKLPIDILAGNEWVRKAIDEGHPIESVDERCREEAAGFESVRARHLLY